MALIKCSECGREISDKAAACIHCGCPVSYSCPTESASANTNTNANTAENPTAFANPNAVEVMKRYNPNGFIQFLRSRRYYSLMFLYFGAIIYMLVEEDPYMASVAAGSMGIFFLPILILHYLYPMHHLKKYCKKHNIVEAIRNDSGYMNVAIVTYNAYPCKKTLKYIRRLNPAAAQRIVQQLAARKKK